MELKKSGGLSPAWLFVTIVAILIGHYIFLGVSLRLCTSVLEREVQIILDKREALPTNINLPTPITPEELAQSRRVCEDLGDQFRNARNKSIEIILALLVPSGVVLGGVAATKRTKND